jgi:hypothetical protein
MSATTLYSPVAGAIGCDLRRAQNQLLFVEYAGKLSRLNLYRTGTIVSSGTGTLQGTWLFDLDTGHEVPIGPTADLWWDQKTSVLRAMAPQNGATLVNLGEVDFTSITPDTLSSLTYASTPIDGNNDASNQLVAGDAFAVHTTAGNYAKVKVQAYGYNLLIEWTTYALQSPYAVLGTGYTEPEDVKASADGAHAYVTERSGDLVKVALSSANRSVATVVCGGMTAPQQLFLDEPHDAAYVVEYAPSGSLWRIDLGAGTKVAVLTGLQNAVGVVLSADLQTAYVSEQTTGPDGGRVSAFSLATGNRIGLATGLTAPFFLGWLDAGQSTLLCVDRDPANAVSAINVASATTQMVASGLAERPSSVAMLTPGQLLVCCDQAIEEVDVSGSFQPNGPLLMGIGFVPFDKVTATGLADTAVDPTYFFQVDNVPFAGTLPLMVNHFRAYNDGARFYRVLVDGVVHTDPWTDEYWNGFEYVAVTTSTSTVGGSAGCYPVRPIGQQFLWMNPSLGDLLPTAGMSDALHTIVLQFLNAGGTVIETSTPLTIRVDNSYCAATASPPELDGNTADGCGLLRYEDKNADIVTMPFTATHPDGFATFSFSLIKGVSGVALPAAPPTSGPVDTAVSPITDTVANLMGSCDIAGFAEYVYVAASATNGWGRQSQFDASAAVAFVLAPASLPLPIPRPGPIPIEKA